MTKTEFISQIIQTVENAESNEEAREGVNSLVNLLEPKDRERFAKWGFKKDQSTPEKCW